MHGMRGISQTDGPILSELRHKDDCSVVTHESWVFLPELFLLHKVAETQSQRRAGMPILLFKEGRIS